MKRTGNPVRWTMVVGAAAVMALTIAAPLQAHHSFTAFDGFDPVWIEGTVVDYRAINPHAVIVLEETTADGEARRWTIEGGGLNRIQAMAVKPTVGDTIEACGFRLTAEVRQRFSTADPYGLSGRFVHGQALVWPDGHWEGFGPYGSMPACVRSSEDKTRSWLEFLKGADRSFRCSPQTSRLRGALVEYPAPEFADEALLEEIGDLLGDCE